MYKLIIVDDDVHVLEGFRRKVDWASLNVEIVGTADNGLDGLEIIKELKPDIVMTDIKMPLMDGVGLMKKIQELDQNIKVVVLSGFGEFEFAKQAMKYNAVDYLLKPTSKEEVSQLTTKLVRMLDEERHEKSVLASHRLLSKLKVQE